VVRVRLMVSGRVQGVGFRWFVRESAREHRLAGWVRNRPDGNVELEASGEEGSVRELIEALRRGPPGARVDDVREMVTNQTDSLPHPFAIVR
jgi:acylphosphatase